MGNLLDNPSLLMRKQFVRDTETVKETLKKGEKFATVSREMAPMALQAMAAPA